MQTLTKREEHIMQIFWKLEKAFIREIISEFPEPKPHYNSIATFVKILEQKGFLNHETLGNTFRYFPLITKEQYQNFALGGIMDKYFDNSLSSLFSYFAKKKKISKEEIDEIMQMIMSHRK